MSKRSIERKLAKTAKRLAVLRGELVAIDEQLHHLRDDADDTAVRSLVADNTGAAREARQAREHLAAHERQRERVAIELAELELRQDQLLDELIAVQSS
ncbi:MAG: hypothetical protein AB8G26_05765 [Ilumatobacter sp.]